MKYLFSVAYLYVICSVCVDVCSVCVGVFVRDGQLFDISIHYCVTMPAIFPKKASVISY